MRPLAAEMTAQNIVDYYNIEVRQPGEPLLTLDDIEADPEKAATAVLATEKQLRDTPTEEFTRPAQLQNEWEDWS